MGFLRAGTFLLPKRGVDITKWAVIACDQFTSQKAYWQEADRFVGESPSTLRLILPEAYMQEGVDMAPYLEGINAAMHSYVDAGVLEEMEGIVSVNRDGRRGLVMCLDLEGYDYVPGKNCEVRATEMTVASRLPWRMEIRKNALLELPHVLVLMDDPQNTVLLAVDACEKKPLYEADLMMGGGHLRGDLIHGEDAKSIEDALMALARKSEFAFAVGDGNHSLAAAKEHFVALKKTMPKEMWEKHPARWALVEIVNLHDAHLPVLPIHRFVFGADFSLLDAWAEGGGESIFCYMGDEKRELHARSGELAIAQLQAFLDEKDGLSLDYLHDEEEVLKLAKEGRGLGFVLPPIARDLVFLQVKKSGVLPRKTFSLGHAKQKRYYMEARRIQ